MSDDTRIKVAGILTAIAGALTTIATIIMA